MQTVIFCTSKNEALEPVTSETPLELLSICGKKIIDYILENLADNGITSCTIVTESVDTKEYIDRLIACDVNADVFLCNEDMSTRDIINTLWNGGDEIMVIQADGVFKLNLNNMIKFHRSKDGFASVYAVKENSDELGTVSAVEFNKQNILERFYKTSDNEFSSIIFRAAPVYIVSVEMLSSLIEETETKDDRKGFFSWINQKKQNIYVYTDENCEAGFDIPFYEKIETVEDFLKTCKKTVLCKAFETGTQIEDGVYSNTPYMFGGVSFIPPVYIGRNVNIGMGSVIGKGTVIEDNSVIGERVNIIGTYLGEYTKIGNRVKTENAVICKNSRVNSGAELKRLSVAGENSVVGENSVISDGVKLWNGKTLPKNTRLKTNLRFGSKVEFSFNEEGSDKIVSPVQAVSIGCALGSVLNIGGSVLVCCESEDCSSYVKALASGIVSAGVSVWDLGLSNSRVADFASKNLKADIYAVVSANPSPKLKLRCPGGLRIKRDMESAIEQRLKTRVFRLEDISDFGKYVFCGGFNDMYVSKLRKIFPKMLRGINVTVKTSLKETAEQADKLISPINDIEGEEIIFHFLDSPNKVTAYSERTGYIIYERLVLLCAKAHLEKNDDVAVPFTFPSVFDDMARNYSAKMYRYFTSSCSEADAKARSSASRESNSFVHDGMYLIADILSYLTENKISLYDAVSELPEFYTSERFLALNDDETAGGFFKELKSKYKRSDEGIVINENKSRAVLKPMRRGKGLMLYVDSEKAETASALCDNIEKRLKGQI